ncbi:endonuclease 8-like 3 [Ylistrum balloti]|uniref:endonuclease 8-like 3 n=1 Tax=Ylistrum balloti TaxID=509963 RepID=UPI002905B911|nr:endonuclease 8-like 3 [Ylistrum balloti]
MVEGPGCKIKGEKIKGKLHGQTVKSVHGAAVDRETKHHKGATTSQFDKLINRKLDGVLTLGKELFMFFGEMCLRVHFLMAGSFLINDKKHDHESGSTSEPPSFEVEFSTDKLAFYKSAADIRSTESCRERYDSLNDVDICSPVFNQKRAVALVIEQKGRQICDVLLDQTILPGVGNIIKNEALFDSGVKPDSKVEELSGDHVSHLVKMTRDFSMIFLKCRRQGTNLGKFLKIYNKVKCTQCDGKVVRCRQGDDSSRMTYFCENCQDNDLVRKKERILPKKNSLLGWVTSGQASAISDQKWACGMCTFINGPSQLNCEMCFTTRTSVQQSGPSSSFLARTLSETRFRGKSQLDRTPESFDIEKPAKRRKVEDTKGDSRIPCCPGHNKKCALREVFKKGDNYGRWFFSCSTRGQQQCKYFQWADDLFPLCEAHGKPCTLRTVLKQGPNNGRQFFVCAVSKKNSKVKCGTFEWAVGFDKSRETKSHDDLLRSP